MIEVLAEHSVDTSLLKPCCTVLDVGCRGFTFGDAIRERIHDAKVVELDIDILPWSPAHQYLRAGISVYDGLGAARHSHDPQATELTRGIDFPVYTLETLSSMQGVDQWDVLKLDCEGSEYDILWNLTRPIAKQLTIEFHQHMDCRRDPAFVAEIVHKLSRWYEVVRHVEDARHCAGLNFWDSLFILK